MHRELTEVVISPEDYERQVEAWLRDTGVGLKSFEVKHLSLIEGDSGLYEIDVVAIFEALGAHFRVLVECKRYKSAVKRDVVLALEGKVRDTGAQKGMIVSTAGFQKSAIKYASRRGIALITLQDGKTNWYTKSRDKSAEIPPWVDVSRYIGWFCYFGKSENVGARLIDDSEKEILKEWLVSNLTL